VLAFGNSRYDGWSWRIRATMVAVSAKLPTSLSNLEGGRLKMRTLKFAPINI
jgi:hypothetical protein